MIISLLIIIWFAAVTYVLLLLPQTVQSIYQASGNNGITSTNPSSHEHHSSRGQNQIEAAWVNLDDARKRTLDTQADPLY